MINTLQQVHIPFAMALKNIAGWNQTEMDWNSYLRLEPQGCFLAQVDGEEDDGHAGTATALSFDGKVGWVGMVLVHPSKRRLGVGTALLEKSIQYLQVKKIPCIKLDATPMGKKVYVPLGFIDEYEVRRYQTTVKTVEETTHKDDLKKIKLQSIQAKQIDQLAQFDAEIFGANRKKVIDGFFHRAPQLAYCMIEDHQVKGYIFAHRGYEAYQIGPFLAEDEIIAEALLNKVLNQIKDEKVFIDVPVPNQEALDMMEKYHFTIQRSFCRMFLGENHNPGQPSKVYGTSGAEKG